MSIMVAERRFNGAVQDDLDGLDKYRWTENDEFIDDHIPHIQGQAVEVLKTTGAESVASSFLSSCKEDLLAVVKAIDARGGGTLAMDILSISDASLRQLYPDQERVQQPSLEQIVDASVPAVADETLECAAGFERPASGGAVCWTTDSTTATSSLPTFTGVMDDLFTVGPSFGCSASRQIANTLDTRICPATSIGNSCAVEVPQEHISECVATQIVDQQDAQASHAALAKTSTKAIKKRNAEIAKDQQSFDEVCSMRAALEISGD